MSSKLMNISGIPYERDIDDSFEKHPEIPNSVLNLRHMHMTPTNFRQPLFTEHYGEKFVDSCKKVLEIGCGTGRNAQFWINETKAKYFAFDTSPTSLKYFEKMGFPKRRYYTSLEMDEMIMKQKYDIIFSTYVLNHIGFSDSGGHDPDAHDSVSITNKLWPTLKEGGYWLSYELHHGQNKWKPDVWYQRAFVEEKKSNELLRTAEDVIEGCEPVRHNLYIIRKTKET